MASPADRSGGRLTQAAATGRALGPVPVSPALRARAVNDNQPPVAGWNRLGFRLALAGAMAAIAFAISVLT